MRGPYLNDDIHSIPSICICVRAAQKIVSIYTKLLFPADGALLVPSTWRQVKRIMISAYIVFITFWYGEASEEEASTTLHGAIALLKSQRHRWDGTVDKAINFLVNLMATSCESKLFDPCCP